MNPRIKELEKQATEFQKIPYGGIDGVFREAFVFNKEKFAELVVKEMLVTCVEHPTWTGRMIGNQIKEHFGVKE